jgi:predicted O-methyltransferase YrrM
MQDPFEMKKFSKWNPRRIIYTLLARSDERKSKGMFRECELPMQLIPGLESLAIAASEDTAVTPLQMAHLVEGIHSTEELSGVRAEVGCYRGVTTKALASQTKRKYVGVDPYIGYGGADGDFAKFRQNTEGLAHVVHEKKTSGAGFRGWSHGMISFVFIDAVHDYVNTAYDAEVWSSLVAPGGIIALHDTDNESFAGTRRAAFEASRKYAVYAHVENLVMLRKK